VLPDDVVGLGPEVCNLRVSNADDLLLDHTGYWTNVEQVHTLLLEEMGGLDATNHFWRGPGLDPPGSWQSRSEQTWNDFNMRRKAVAQLAGVRLGTLGTFPLTFALLLWFNGWAKGTADFLQLDWIARSVRFSWLSDVIASPDLSVAATVGLATLVSILLFAGLFISVYFGFKFAWWNRTFESRRRLRNRKFRDWRIANNGGRAAA
jgi:hypothetical protein